MFARAYPSSFGKATAPSAEVEDAEPKEDAAFDPVSNAAKDSMAFLQEVSLGHCNMSSLS